MFCYFNEIWNVILVSNVICWTFLVKKFYKKPQLFITVYVIFTQTVVVWLTRPNFSHHLSLGIRWRHTKTQLTCAKSKHNLFTMWFLLCSIEEHDHHIENKMSHNNAKKWPTQKKLHRCNNGIVCNVGCPGLQAAGDLYVNWCQIFVAIWGM